ncbi:Uncharacterized conserved protein, LemA [gamma proteobacterium HdN1]|nr:Uncharacterized conserved protein, LemA [gamma proteobacterium HdN1]
MIFTAVSLLAWLGFYLWYLLAYNQLVALLKTCEQAWAHVEVELQRRHDLIGNLVNVVKAYAQHEATVLQQTTRARSAGPMSVVEANRAGHEDAQRLSGLLALVERYPQLKADTQFTQLQQSLIDTENRIAERRSAYNQCVNRYEILRTTIPSLLVAWAGRFAMQGFFDAQDETAAAVRVNLS